MRYKIQKSLLTTVIGTGMLMASALAVHAEIPEDFWEYNLAYDEENNTIYEFDELEIVIPEDWEGRYEVEEVENGLRFYSTAVREYSQEMYPEWKSGDLFTIRVSQDYESVEGMNYSYIIGSSDEYIYYLSVEQAEAYAPEDVQSMEEWRELVSDRDWIEERAVVTQPGIVDGMTLYAITAVNIRSKATIESAIMGIVPQGYAVTVTGAVQNGWIPVEYIGIKGYIRQDLLKDSVEAIMNSGSNLKGGDASVYAPQGTTNLQGTEETQGIDYAAMFNSDGAICGTILSKDLSSGVIIHADDGNEYHFKYGKETTWLFGETGDYVEIQYHGILKEEPQVQCMTKKATKEELNGGVQNIEGIVSMEGNDILAIQTADGVSYSFLIGSTAWPEGCTTGDTVMISYRGTLDAPEVISVVKK